MIDPVELRHCLAPAKLNLLLHVLGQRDDGYHEIETVFDLIDLQDSMHFSIRSDGAIMRRGGLHGLAHDTDLSVRAARMLAAASETRLGADIEIVKRIPAGGGLGGGSSNAATTLLALNRLWGIHWPLARLSRLALQLGADVPVFIQGTAALAAGIGEKFTPLALPAQWYVLLAPSVVVPTTEIFSAPELTRDSKPLKISPLSRQNIGEAGRNDLEPVACGRYPAVQQALVALSQAARQVLKSSQGSGRVRENGGSGSQSDQDPGLPWPSARMSGSGGCVFYPAPDQDSANRIAERVGKSNTGKVHVVRSLSEHPMRTWAFAKGLARR